MQEYCCVYPTLRPKEVLLIRKSKPAWQKGKLNLVGGKIEPGERVEQAAKRELEEESALVGSNFKVRGAVQGIENRDPKYIQQPWIVWFITCDIDADILTQQTEEFVFWWPFRETLKLENLLPNLKLIIPLLETKAPDWTIRETSDGLQVSFNSWEIELCTNLR